MSSKTGSWAVAGRGVGLDRAAGGAEGGAGVGREEVGGRDEGEGEGADGVAGTSRLWLRRAISASSSAMRRFKDWARWARGSDFFRKRPMPRKGHNQGSASGEDEGQGGADGEHGEGDRPGEGETEAGEFAGGLALEQRG